MTLRRESQPLKLWVILSSKVLLTTQLHQWMLDLDSQDRTRTCLITHLVPPTILEVVGSFQVHGPWESNLEKEFFPGRVVWTRILSISRNKKTPCQISCTVHQVILGEWSAQAATVAHQATSIRMVALWAALVDNLACHNLEHQITRLEHLIKTQALRNQ